MHFILTTAEFIFLATVVTEFLVPGEVDSAKSISFSGAGEVDSVGSIRFIMVGATTEVIIET